MDDYIPTGEKLHQGKRQIIIFTFNVQINTMFLLEQEFQITYIEVHTCRLSYFITFRTLLQK